jgi:hypothetical protein
MPLTIEGADDSYTERSGAIGNWRQEANLQENPLYNENAVVITGVLQLCSLATCVCHLCCVGTCDDD